MSDDERRAAELVAAWQAASLAAREAFLAAITAEQASTFTWYIRPADDLPPAHRPGAS